MNRKAVLALTLGMLFITVVVAQQVTGVPGAPNATTTIEGKQFPPPDPKFGGVIPTPTMDRLAANGLLDNRLFSTALCSPTRAALITGRDHHSAGFGVLSEQSTGYPGYNSIIDRDKATIGRILLENGYNTSWFGKDHNVPAFQARQTGPFDDGRRRDRPDDGDAPDRPEQAAVLQVRPGATRAPHHPTKEWVEKI